MSIFRPIILAGSILLLSACAGLPSMPGAEAPVPAQWHAPLPHQGTLADLSGWWRAQGDPLLPELIDAAQSLSPTVAAARSRIEQARAARVVAAAALLPAVNGAASVARSSAQPPLPMGTTSQAALQPAWEIDLFGGNRAGRDAAEARLQGAQAAWHDARVSVAAEVASQYYGLRTCRQLLAVAESDAASRAETSRLTRLAADAGFQAPATAALARASAAEASGRVLRQRADCEMDIKALVALSGISEPELRARLAAAPAPIEPAPLAIDRLPARLLAQRPDIFAAEREVAAASADIGSAEAQRYPRLTLSGSVGVANFKGGGFDTTLDTWSIGPLALTVPLFDGGRRAAGVEAARARYEEATANYRARVRQAVREVEQALVTLDSTARRNDDARTAVEGYRASYDATEARYRNGLASLIELEETRRARLAAENSLATLELERRNAWVGLYRAAGGGWDASAAPPLSGPTAALRSQ
ncbi:MAG: transporter [Noviherbaspirillum sp.]|nr:transporter [Noviherbaspirillum sp.]